LTAEAPYPDEARARSTGEVRGSEAEGERFEAGGQHHRPLRLDGNGDLVDPPVTIVRVRRRDGVSASGASEGAAIDRVITLVPPPLGWFRGDELVRIVAKVIADSPTWSSGCVAATRRRWARWSAGEA
jgi:hypothetical protein